MSGVVKDGVLAIVWQDTNLVDFLTTAHDGSAKTTVKRKRPAMPIAGTATLLKRSGGTGQSLSDRYQRSQWSTNYKQRLHAMDAIGVTIKEEFRLLHGRR